MAAILDLVLIVLLPESDGGLRPIGLFPTVIRLWMRARVCIARAWESLNHLPRLFGGVGMGAQRAAWQAAFAAELAALKCQDHVQVLLDLVKAFETIPHHKLIAAARAKGYCLCVLILSLAAYRLQRSAGVNGVYSRMLRATRGITAGSGFATSELRLLLLDMMLELQRRWVPVLNAMLYVDDLTLSATGQPGTIVPLMSNAVAFVTSTIEEDLALEVSAKKSTVLASRPSIAVMSAQRMAKVRAAKHAKLLGASTVGGRRRSVRSLKVRLHAFTKMVKRIHVLRKAGVRTCQIVRAAGTPSVMYGSEIAGILRFFLASSPIHDRSRGFP